MPSDVDEEDAITPIGRRRLKKQVTAVADDEEEVQEGEVEEVEEEEMDVSDTGIDVSAPEHRKMSDEVESIRSSKHRRLRRSHKGEDKQAQEQIDGSGGGYSWEDEYRRSWDIVQEDESGSLETIVSGLVESQKKRYLKNVTPFQRGIIRIMVLVLDYSKVMREKDLRPNRASMMISYAIDFVNEFFDQNPISQLSIVIMRNGLAQIVSEVSGNPHDHIEALKRLRRTEPEGDPSLQNALEMSRGLLLHVASHCTREVLIIFGALFTSDPGNIHNTIKELVKEKISVRVIGLTARVAICDELCRLTNHGDLKSSYSVILNEQHFRELFMDAVTPLAITKSESQNKNGFTLVKMGFPQRISEENPTFCACHSRLVYGGYICPNCKSKVCGLPTVCPCCDLMLILSTHLARSYHHLFPLTLFVEVPVASSYPTKRCFGCQREFSKGVDLSEKGKAENKHRKEYLSSSRYRCTECGTDFCIDCDVFIHEVLHNCPGCESDSRKK
ncbi:DEKNAAC101933 [Brettanomyces naardenensis]|uniref:General transcription and DNA repair factor IIH n=1 Tax=Brettanomyces naardenensis TaxID=13370 RepID=A0A448YJK9_BRENA|nr:DEKNAAC101933 [Brettanomyces naardenensis]